MYHIVGGRIDIKVHLHVRRLTTQKAKYLIWQITPILFSLLTFLLSRCYDNDYFVFFSRYDYSQHHWRSMHRLFMVFVVTVRGMLHEVGI